MITLDKQYLARLIKNSPNFEEFVREVLDNNGEIITPADGIELYERFKDENAIYNSPLATALREDGPNEF